MVVANARFSGYHLNAVEARKKQPDTAAGRNSAKIAQDERSWLSTIVECGRVMANVCTAGDMQKTPQIGKITLMVRGESLSYGLAVLWGTRIEIGPVKVPDAIRKCRRRGDASHYQAG